MTLFRVSITGPCYSKQKGIYYAKAAALKENLLNVAADVLQVGVALLSLYSCHRRDPLDFCELVLPSASCYSKDMRHLILKSETLIMGKLQASFSQKCVH